MRARNALYENVSTFYLLVVFSQLASGTHLTSGLGAHGGMWLPGLRVGGQDPMGVPGGQDWQCSEAGKGVL